MQLNGVATATMMLFAASEPINRAARKPLSLLKELQTQLGFRERLGFEFGDQNI